MLSERSTRSITVSVPTPPMTLPLPKISASEISEYHNLMERSHWAHDGAFHKDFTTNAVKTVHFNGGRKLKIVIEWRLTCSILRQKQWFQKFKVEIERTNWDDTYFDLTLGIVNTRDDSGSYLHYRNYSELTSSSEFRIEDDGLIAMAVKDGRLTFEFNLEYDKIKQPKSFPMSLLTKLKDEATNKPDFWLVAQNGKKVPCLKYFLKLRSEPFKAILDNPDTLETKTNRIHIDDYDEETIKAFAAFIVSDATDGWTGKGGQTAINLLALGHRYLIEELVSAAKTSVYKQLDAKNATAVLELANQIGAQDLADSALHYMAVIGKVSDNEIDDMPTEVLRTQFKQLLKHKQ